MRCEGIDREGKEERMRPEERELHELPFTVFGKSGTIRTEGLGNNSNWILIWAFVCGTLRQPSVCMREEAPGYNEHQCPSDTENILKCNSATESRFWTLYVAEDLSRINPSPPAVAAWGRQVESSLQPSWSIQKSWLRIHFRRYCFGCNNIWSNQGLCVRGGVLKETVAREFCFNWDCGGLDWVLLMDRIHF